MNHRPQIACVSTIFHKYSHTQHFVDRFLEGYGWNSRHHRPPMDLVSLYVDQVGDDDSRACRSKPYGGGLSDAGRGAGDQGGPAVESRERWSVHGEYLSQTTNHARAP